jgi:hypothetical protein
LSASDFGEGYFVRPAPIPWLCPVCVNVLEPGFHDCPKCGLSAAWLDLLRASDFALRRYQLWKCQGILTPEEYCGLLAHCRRRREALVRSASNREPVPVDTGLPDPCQCWSCKKPDLPRNAICPDCGAELETEQVRILRFHAYLCKEVRLHWEAGRLSSAQWQAAMSDTPARQIELLQRLGRGTV